VSGYEDIDGHRVWGSAPTPAVPAPTVPQAPDSLTHLLHLPGVYVQADEDNAQVVIGMSPDHARAIADYAPNPLQVRLAAQLVDAALLDLEDAQ
jgi:hypothetical protein